MPYKGRTAVSWPRRGCRGLHLHGGAFPTAAPDRLRHRGYGIWITAPAYQRRPGSTGSIRKGLQSREAKPSGGEPTSQWPTAASWRRSFQTLARTRATGDTWGQVAAASGEEFEQRGAPVRSAHCFRVSPDPGESWSTAMGLGRRHRQVQRRELQGKIASISRYDAPQGRLSRAGEGFSPAVSHVQGRIYLTRPFTVIESTAGGAALVAAAQAADRDRRGGSHITISRGV